MDNLFLYRIHSKTIDDKKSKYLSLFRENLLNLKRNKYLVLIADNTPIDVENVYRKYQDGIDGEFESVKSNVLIPNLPNNKLRSPNYYTFFQNQMNKVKELASDNTVVFFCEDDYMYRPDAFEKAILFAKSHPTDFITLYDHPNRYRPNRGKEEYEFPLELIWEYNHHWRTCISTCLTFACTKAALVLNKDLFIDPVSQFRDHTMWCAMWRKGRSRLWGSIPGLASHRNGPHLNDWNWDDT